MDDRLAKLIENYKEDEKLKISKINEIKNNKDFYELLKVNNFNDELIFKFHGTIYASYMEFLKFKNNQSDHYYLLSYEDGFINKKIIFNEKIKKLVEKESIHQKFIYSDMLKVFFESDFKQIYYSNIRAKLYLYFLELKNNHKGIYLFGETGMGKTHILSFFAKDLVMKDNEVAYITIPFMQNHFMNLSIEEKNKLLKNLQTVQYLFIDDIGSEYVNDYFIDSFLFPLIFYRSDNKLISFYSSNRSVKQLEDYYKLSLKKSDNSKITRIIRRIKDSTIELEIDKYTDTFLDTYLKE